MLQPLPWAWRLGCCCCKPTTHCNISRDPVNLPVKLHLHHKLQPTSGKLRVKMHMQTHSHFTTLSPGLSGWASARRNLLLDFVVQGKITEAYTPTIWLGATPSRLISNPRPSSPHFLARCPSCHSPSTSSWLGTGTKYAGLHTQW